MFLVIVNIYCYFINFINYIM